MEKQLLELPYNAVKINFSNNINSISKALDICDRAKKLNLPIIIDTTTLLSRNHYSSPDTFESDFAVGVGAVQFYGNGFYDTNYLNKISRLQEIERESENQIPYIGGKFRTGPIV
jgi:enolase